MRRRDIVLLVPRPVRRLPADLAATVALVALTNAAVFLPLVRETPLRVALGLPFVLFVPGYAVIAALFPEEGAGDDEGDGDGAEGSSDGDEGTGPVGGVRERGIDGIERVALSFGLSIAVVPLVGLVLNFTPWGIRLAPIMVAVSGVTLAATGVAASRRRALPAAERFRVPYRTWYRTGRAELLEPDSRADAALNVLLVASVVLAVASVGYAVAVPKQGEAFTEFYLLTENESGDLVADGYPTEMTAGEPTALTVGVGNNEHRTETYTVVAELQRVRTVNDTRVRTTSDGTDVRRVNETIVEEATEVARFRPTVRDNGTWLRSHTVTPRRTGERLRLQYLLYREEPPEPPNRSAAYRELHLWVNVTE